MQIITIQYFFWQHLVNAELITPKVEWINITDNDPNLTRTRIQKSKGISGAGISVTTNGNDISGYSTSIKPSSLHNSYFFGGTDSIDVKLDDGKSYTGYVRGANANGICEDGASSDPLDYYDIAYISANSLSETGNCNPTFLYK